MPKLTKIQTNFNSGEVAPGVYGRTDSDRYDTGLSTCLNYIPTIQGPLLRRPGTKYVANVKDTTKPPTLIPFNASDTASYILEFGDKYIRFHTNDGQVLTNTTVFQVNGFLQFNNTNIRNLTFNSTRDTSYAGVNEGFLASSVLANGAIFELNSPYAQADVSGIRFAQSQDTIYLAHTKYPPFKLQRKSTYNWDLKPIIFQDGPYLPLNSYQSIGDSVSVQISPFNQGQIQSAPWNAVYAAAASPTGAIRLTLGGSSTFQTGQRVFVKGVTGTVEANNGTSSIAASYWTASVPGANQIDLLGSTYVNTLTNSTGFVYPALWQMATAPTSGSSPVWADATLNFCRTISFANNGTRAWGIITQILDPNTALITLNSGSVIAAGNNSIWQLGVSSVINGFPGAVCFHQNRLLFTGTPQYPQQIDGSQSANYEAFAASNSSYVVSDASALQFNLTSADTNPSYWMKSVSQGLLVGSRSAEWQVSPNSQYPALTPTNISAQQTSAFGSANMDAVQIGNAVIYAQAAGRRIREMNYFVQVGSFRSTNLSELSEHITLPNITQLAVQKEALPIIWAVRADGTLLSLSYNRDDISLKAGFAKHILGGQSDSAGTQPVVKSIAVATASSTLHQELWMTVQRSINGSSVCTIEYMTRQYLDNSIQEDAWYLDCGSVYDNPIAIQTITNASSCVINATAHGFTNSSSVKFNTLIGLNSSVVDANGNTSVVNLLNGKTFVVASSSTNSFKIQDFIGNDINSQSYTAYLGSGVVRKLVTNITGLNWLNGDTVSVLGDGGIQPAVVVNGSGAIKLGTPAAKVQVGYAYNSDAQTLRTKEGSAQGTSIGSTRRCNRVAFMVHNVAELSVGPAFTKLMPVEFQGAPIQPADMPILIKDGVYREGFQGEYTFDDFVCFRQSAPLPGTIQAVVRFLEEFDV